MDSDPASLLLFPMLKRNRRYLCGASFLLALGEKQPALPDSTLLTACLLLSRRLFLLIEVVECLLDLPADDWVFWEESKTPEALLADPGVDVPLNRVLGSNSIPRFFLIDLRFLFENPKE